MDLFVREFIQMILNFVVTLLSSTALGYLIVPTITIVVMDVILFFLLRRFKL